MSLHVVNGSGDANVDVPHGESHDFVVTPNENYNLSSGVIECTGTATGSMTSTGVKISNVTEAQTCTVTLSLVTYKVNINVTNGTSTAANKTISHGGSATATITPNTGYTLVGSTVTGDGCSLDETSGILTISNVVKAGSCNITLVKEKYSVSLSGTNVTVSDSPKTVEYLGSTTFTVTPGTGFTLSNATVNCSGLESSNITVSGSTVTLKI